MPSSPPESALGFLASDGERLQCHECGEWFIQLATHARSAHDLDPEEYRAAWGLPRHVRLAGELHRQRARAHALQRVAATSGPFRGFTKTRVDPASLPEFEEQAHTLWNDRLAAAGWGSWAEAIAWADESGSSWRAIGERLGVSGTFARDAALSEGTDVHLQKAWDRMVSAATNHVTAHGSLLGATGELAEWLSNARSDAGKGVRGMAFDQLDALDPEWRLPQAQRLAAARAAGIVVPTGKGMAAQQFWRDRLAAAGYRDWDALLVWAAKNHAGLDEIGDQLGFNAKYMFEVLPCDDPFTATVPFRDSVPGHLADNGARVQCHDCGLWFGDLKQHIRRHTDSRGAKYTTATYRRAHGLAPEVRLAPATLSRETAFRTVWGDRFAAAGVSSWEELLAWAAQTHVGVEEIGNRIGTRGSNVLSALRTHLPQDTFASTEPFRLSGPGHLEDDGSRVQCHDCGLWYRRLAPKHIKQHSDRRGRPYSVDSYRRAHRLPPGLRLNSR